MAKVQAQLPSELEVQLIKNFIILPHVLNVFERDKNRIKDEQIFKTYKPYVALLEQVMDGITKDLSRVRQELRKRGIKVYDGERIEKELRYEYLCRGYMGTFAILLITLKSDVEIVMNHYLGVYESELVKAGCL
jgi:hypothetical protein